MNVEASPDWAEVNTKAQNQGCLDETLLHLQQEFVQTDS